MSKKCRDLDLVPVKSQSRSLKVVPLDRLGIPISIVLVFIGADPDRSVTYDFLLMFHSNRGLSRTMAL